MECTFIDSGSLIDIYLLLCMVDTCVLGGEAGELDHIFGEDGKKTWCFKTGVPGPSFYADY